MRYWLMKSEPDEVSIDDVEQMPGRRVGWFGVRNYQARNFMRDEMARGDLALFYHSSCALPGIAGIVEVCSPAYPDPTQFDAASKYFDAKSALAAPRWWQIDVRFKQKTRLVSLAEMRSHEPLAGMKVLQKGNRLSITPVTEGEWIFLLSLL